jgi:hypothetical protein
MFYHPPYLDQRRTLPPVLFLFEFQRNPLKCLDLHVSHRTNFRYLALSGFVPDYTLVVALVVAPRRSPADDAQGSAGRLPVDLAPSPVPIPYPKRPIQQSRGSPSSSSMIGIGRIRRE